MKLLNRFFGYLKKDFYLVYKRKKFFYLFLGIPLILALLFNFFLNPVSYKLNAGVCDLDKSSLSRNVLTADNINFKILNEENCTELLKRKIILKEIDFGIVIPKNFEEEINNLKQSHLKVIYDNTDVTFSNLISWKVDAEMYRFKRRVIDEINKNLKEDISVVEKSYFVFKDYIPSSFKNKATDFEKNLNNIKELDTEFILNPIWTSKEPIYEEKIKEKAGIVYVFPIISLITILMLSSISIIYDRKNGFLTRVKSNSFGLTYLLAKVLFFVILVFVQFLIVLSIFFFNGIKYDLSLNFLVLVLAVGILNCLTGFIIGFLSENEGIAVLFSLIISFPLMLISGIFYPVQTLPKIVQYLFLINPLSYQISLSKSIILFNQLPKKDWVYLSILLFLISFWLLKRDKLFK